MFSVFRNDNSRPKADYYADPIPSFRFWSGRKNKYHSCKIETGFLCFFALVIQQLGFWTQKIQSNVDYYYVWCRAECASLGPGLKLPSLLSDSTLAAKRFAEVIHVVFFSTTIRAQHDELLLCVYSRMIRSHERRALGALLLFLRSEPASIDS